MVTVDGANVSRIVLELPVIVPSTDVEELVLPAEGDVCVIFSTKLSVKVPVPVELTTKVPKLLNVGTPTLTLGGMPAKVMVDPPVEVVSVKLLNSPLVE